MDYYSFVDDGLCFWMMDNKTVDFSPDNRDCHRTVKKKKVCWNPIQHISDSTYDICKRWACNKLFMVCVASATIWWKHWRRCSYPTLFLSAHMRCHNKIITIYVFSWFQSVLILIFVIGWHEYAYAPVLQFVVGSVGDVKFWNYVMWNRKG